MSKLSFRARALDPCKPMPIYLAEELPDLPEYSAINRAVPQMPSGMEKEEESEHHLQRAICTGLIIPTPEVFATDVDFYEKNYPANYKMPRQLIHMQPLGLEQDIPDYDMDSADELWMNSQARRLDLTPLKFEQMMDKLEKSSGQTVVTLNEAKALLKQDDEVSTAVYDYWLNKRLKTQHPLILSVKTENRSGTAANNPYLAFRRRTEKMQTRKNRKNDETSYEKMLKLRRDLSRAVTLLEMVKKREKNKREQLHLSIEVFEKRYQLRDFNGSIMSELSSSVKSSRPAFAPIYTNQYSHHSSSTQVGSLIASSGSSQQPPQHHHYSSSSYHASGIGVSGSSTSAATKRDLDASSRKEKRQYKKRKHKLQRDRQYTVPNVVSPAAIESTISSEDEDLGGSHLVGSEGEDEGLYAFRRKQSCEYHRPLTKDYGNWPWESKENNGQGDPRFRFTLTSIKHPRPRCIGFARRRVGRGGRVILDRIATNGDDLWSQLDYTILDNRAARKAAQTEGADNEKIESTCLSDDETSRDSKYVSSAFDPVTSTYDSLKCIKKESDSIYSGYSDVVSYSNSYSNLCSRLICDTEVSYTSSEKEKETGGISDLLNKKIKQEISEDAYVGGDDWARLIKEGNRSPSLLEQQDSGIVVDLVRTQCLNRISNRNISGNNNNNNLTTGYNTSFSGSGDVNATSRTLLNKRHSSETSIANVIKDEILTVIKRECETDTNNSDDDNVDLASLSNILHASRGTAVASVSGMSAASDMKFDDYLGSDRSLKYEEPLTHSNFVDLNTNTKLLQSSEFWGAEPKADLDVLTAGRSTANFEEGDNDKEVIYKEFLEEINKDWLHFYPKTPSPCADENIFEDNTKPFVDFSEQTPITIELQRVDKCVTPPQPCTPPSSVFTSKIESDPSFVTMAFSYNDLAGDEQSLLLNATTDSSNSGIDFNLSGDSLAELNLSLGEDENEKMLENILEECQIDDLKTLNQTTTFWDGILEDGGLLDVIEEKKGVAVDAEKAADVLVNGAENTMINAKEETKRYPMKRKASVAKLKVGSSYFAVKNASKDEKFFCKEEPQSTNPQQSMICEPPEELLEVPHTAQQGAAESTVPNSRLAVRISGSNSSQVSTSTNVLSQISATNNMPIKVLIKPETPAGNVSTVSTPIVTTINQVPINQMNASQVMATIPSNVKLGISNMIRITGTTTSLSDAIGSIGTSSVSNASSNMSNTVTVPSLLMTSIQPHQQTSQHQLSTQQPQQHIILRQITQSSQTQQQLIQNSSGTASTSAANYTTDGSGAIVIATNKTSPTKRQTNGPTDKNALQHILKQRCPNRRFNLLKQTYVDEDYIVQTTQKSQQTQAQQHLQTSSGSIIKIPQLPVIVPELNFQQQQQQGQQQSQQQNTVSASAAVAVASNHNYSLQPTAQPIAIIGQQSSGNKIILNTSGAGGTVVGGANFTIATPISDLSAKIQYESIPTSNIKVNLVTSSGIQQGSLIMDAKNSQMVKNSLQQHQQAQITVATGHQQAQTQLHQARKTVNMFIDPDQKRVLCKLVNLHNLSPLQTKNSAGQTVQVSSGAAAHLLNKAHTVQRLGNSAIVANVRALAVNNQVIGTTTNAGVNATASLNSIVAGVASTAQSGSSAASGADVSATHKTQSTNSSGTNNNSSGSDTTANVVSSGINLNTTNR